MANKIIYINNKKATIDGSWLILDPGLRELILSTDGNGTLTATSLNGPWKILSDGDTFN